MTLNSLPWLNKRYKARRKFVVCTALLLGWYNINDQTDWRYLLLYLSYFGVCITITAELDILLTIVFIFTRFSFSYVHNVEYVLYLPFEAGSVRTKWWCLYHITDVCSVRHSQRQGSSPAEEAGQYIVINQQWTCDHQAATHCQDGRVGHCHCISTCSNDL